MSKQINATERPDWLKDADEFPHSPPDIPLWSESYMTYVYSPGNQVGVWVHLGYKPGSPGLWEETLVIALPGNRYLVARAFSARPIGQEVSINGVAWRCDAPFQKWTKRFQGGAQLVSGDELRAGPLRDGLYRPIDLELVCEAITPPNDYGLEHKHESSSWGTNGHYEQTHQAHGHLDFDGEKIAIDGTGWRDHSWGPRDLLKFGSHTWLSAQFPGGRSLMAVHLQGPAPAKPFVHALLYEKGALRKVAITGMPIANDIAETESDFACEIATAEHTSTIRATILQTIRLGMLGTNQIGIGTHRGPDAHHDWVSCFTRFEWDGETGYGSSERSVDLTVKGKQHG